MARWEPNPQERLVRAALDLFAEQGYDRTTVAQIAERAGLTKSTFFRHFPDKREVLFAGQDILSRLFTDAIAAAPDSATPLEAVGAGLHAAAAVFPAHRRDFAAQRRDVVAANTELQEREALKRGVLAGTMSQALQARGVPEATASIAAALGSLAFSDAFARWADPANDREFASVAGESLRRLQLATASVS